jgi:lysophospholipase L1-like esterase
MGKAVFTGDSVTASANVALGQRWVQIVGLAAGYAPADIINAGVPGNTSAQILARLQADVLSHSPDVVVMMFTVNDGGNGVPLATHEANYRSMIGQCQAAGAKVVLITPPVYRQNVSSWRAWRAKWMQLAAEYGCHFVDVTSAYGWEYAADSYAFGALYVNSADLVHQSVAGNARIAEICAEPIHALAFVKQAPEQPVDCPECPPAATELMIALADAHINGATVVRLQRVIDAMSQ